MSRQGGYQGYGAVQEYRDDPSYREYQDSPGQSYDQQFSQIANNISKINTGGNTIEKLAKVIGTDRDNGQAGSRIHEVSQETTSIVSNTTRQIKQLGTKKLDRAQRLRLDKVKTDFQDSVQRFQTLQKRASEKARSSSQIQKQKVKSSVWQDDDDDDHARLVEDDSRRQQLLAQEQVIDDDLALIQEREEQIRALEGDILDVNEIFRDLGAMVYEQGEQIDTIEANVEKAYTDVEQGRDQLQKAATYQRKSRKKMCCLLMIFLIIAVIITIIVLVSVKH